MLADGVPVVDSAADSLALVELRDGRLEVLHQIAVPASLVGPPGSVAVHPAGLALVTAATQRDPEDPNRVVPADVVTVVALDPHGETPPRIVATLHTGAGASGISINAAGTLALVANRREGSISILSIDGTAVAEVGRLALGSDSGPSHVAFTPDGRHALVTREGNHRIGVLEVNGRQVTLAKRELFAGVRPYALDISTDGAYAAVANAGGGLGDIDTVSLIDLRWPGFRVVDTVSVGQTPEGIAFVPGRHALGVTIVGGSNKPAASPFHGLGEYREFDIRDGRLVPGAAQTGGRWLQGLAYSADGLHVVIQDALGRALMLYRLENGGIVDTGERLPLDATPSGLVRWH